MYGETGLSQEILQLAEHEGLPEYADLSDSLPVLQRLHEPLQVSDHRDAFVLRHDSLLPFLDKHSIQCNLPNYLHTCFF